MCVWDQVEQRRLCCLTTAGLFLLLVPVAKAQVKIDSQTSAEAYPGVEHISGRVTLSVDGKKANFDATVISLCNDYIHIDATEPGLGLMTPASWGKRAGVQVALNGDFFTASYVYGDAVGGGARWPASATGINKDGWFNKDYGWIAFGENWVDYTHTKLVKGDNATYPTLRGWKPAEVAPSPPNGTFALVSGFPELVVEGKKVTCSSPTVSTCWKDRSDMRDRHPRSAMGLTKDRKQFILLAVDGRSTSSAGMYGTELADLMHKLGAYVAFNLDGGGSTGMWFSKSGYVNVPSGGSARSVKNHWGVFAGSGSGMGKVAGSCVAERACDGRDEDYDGTVDEGFESRTCTLEGCLEAQQACTDGAWSECTCLVESMPSGDASVNDGAIQSADAAIPGIGGDASEIPRQDGGVVMNPANLANGSGFSAGGCALSEPGCDGLWFVLLTVVLSSRRRHVSFVFR